ncbi:hypothetical protein [Microbispora sp. NPDC049125]|uniref:hypothetical protein n=1 Tax=Microbispora sp. NPDC049125 TaxID=3154929 RepID=UPI00346769E1
MSVTRHQAEKVLALVKKTYSAYIDPEHCPHCQPQIIENFEGARYAIEWANGEPYEWAISFPGGGTDETVYQLASDAGVASNSAYEFAQVPSVVLPAGVHVEAMRTYILGIYEA